MNRRWKGWIVVVGMFVIVFAIGAVAAAISGDSAKRPPIDEQLTSLELPLGTTLDSLQSAEVVSVIDGDTIEVKIDGRTERVRYFGVDTPERGDRCFREATDRNDLLLDGTVLLLPDERKEDEFGRLLRYVFLPDGTSLDATLVAEGFGEAWRKDGRYRDQIEALERQAQAAGRGCLWENAR